MLIALAIVACFAALIAFYSVLVHNALPVQEDESGIPMSAVRRSEVETRKAA